MAALSFGSSRISAGMVVTARRGRRCEGVEETARAKNQPLFYFIFCFHFYLSIFISICSLSLL